MASRSSRPRWLGRLMLAACAAVVRPAAAQCPDGTLEPCGVRPVPRPIDPQRIAILPFRISGADPALGYLRNGLVELLTAEFNGELGPVAVEPGEALRAWSRSNAGQEPATPSAALQVARRLGAGQVTYASIVGTPRRFTVTISILNVPSGAARVPAIQVQGTEDSLAALIASLSARLLGRSVGGISGSDAALRAFNSGMAAYRRGSGREAENQFNRALSLDSSFVQAAYRLVVLRALFGPTGPITPLALRAAWTGRQRLSAEQRVLLETIITEDEVFFRAQMLPRLERSIDELPNSVEAWDVLGDLYFHVGALIGREDWADRAKRAMRRAVALDSVMAESSRDHLAELAYLAGDPPAVRPPARTPWHRYLYALLSGGPVVIRAARTEYVRTSLQTGDRRWLLGITLPPGEVDSLLLQLEALANTEVQRRGVAQLTLEVAQRTGRLSQGTAATRLLFPGGVDSVAAAMGVLVRAHGLDLDRLSDEWLSARLGSTVPMNGAVACEIGLSRLRRSETTGVAAILAALPQWEPGRDLGEMRRGLGHGPRSPEQRRLETEREIMICREVLAGVLGSFEPETRAALLRADTVSRFSPMNGGVSNYDLGVAFARVGDYAAAARAVRRRWLLPGGLGGYRLPISLRQEGRWAALAGDTAAAIRAYRAYLIWRSNPEPLPPPLPRDALIAQRDSVRAELAALEKSYRKPTRPKRIPNNSPVIQ